MNFDMIFVILVQKKNASSTLRSRLAGSSVNGDETAVRGAHLGGIAFAGHAGDGITNTWITTQFEMLIND